jgi:hypothetical protein
MSINQWRIGRIGPGKQNLIGVPGSSVVGHLYWRMLISGVFGEAGVDLFEAEFLLSGVDQTGTGTATSSSNYPGQPPALAFDNDTNTRWNSDFTNSWPQWLGYTFLSPVNIDAVSVTVAISTQRAPANISVQYSDDGSVWTESWNVSTGVVGDWTLGVRRQFDKP